MRGKIAGKVLCCILWDVFSERNNFADWKKEPLVIALTISIALHLGVFGGWKIGEHFGWWKNLAMPRWLQRISEKLTALPPPLKNPPRAQVETPLVFIDVDPNTSVKEPPPDTEFYSSANSRLASPKKLDSV
ncbi:MAG: hypothetical protein ABJC04_14055, partial [Verrucomicrobiota bacterium]